MYTTPRTIHTSTGIFTNIKLYVTLLLSLLLVSCGSVSSDPADPNADSTISINVTKGPVAKANCMLTDAAGNTITSTTNSNGLFVTTSKIAVGALTIACSGGSYTDEATGSVIDAPTMHAVGYHSGNDFSATVSPLSEIAYQRAIALVGMENIASLSATVSDEHKKIATLFGLEGIDILNTVPTPLVGTGATTAANDDTGKFAIVLAGLSQLFVDTYGTATQVTQGIKALATDLADNTFDDKETLVKAIEAFDDANKDSLNYDDTIVEDLTQAIGSATTTLTEVAAPVISLTTGESISYTVGDTIIPLVFNSNANNGGATECSISALPPGLQLNGTTDLSAPVPATSSGTCELTGTLTTASSSTEYTLTVGNIRATDSATIDIIVNKIEQAPLSVPSRLTTATFGDDPLTVSATGGSTDGEVTATNSSNQSVATVSGTQITITGAGDTTITLTKAGDNNYLPVTTTYTLTVAKAEQATLNNTGKTTTVFSDIPLRINATGGSGDGEVTATNSSNQSVATVSGTQISITGVGDTMITLTKAGDNNYLPITTTYTLTVNKAPLTLTFNNNQTIQHSKEAGNLDVSTFSLTGNTGNGFVSYSLTDNTNNIGTLTQAGVFTPQGTNIGTAMLVVTVAETTNYLAGSTSVTLDVIDKTQQSDASLSFNTDPLTVAYSTDGTITDRTATRNGGVGTLTYSSSNPSIATVNQTTGVVTIVSVGTAIITARLSGDNTYAPLPKQYELTVTQGEQATLNNTGKTTATFGDDPLTVSATGGSTDGEVTATNSSNQSVATVSGTQITITGAGDTTITLTKAGNNNYLPVTTTYTFSVAKAEQATLNNTGKTTATFGDTPLTVSATGGSTDGEVTATSSSNQSVATVSGTQITITGAGDTTITLTKAGNNNYLPVTTTYTFSVAKAEQATLNNTGKTTATFGDTPLTVSATGGSTDGEVTATNSSNQSVATVSGRQITITGVGATTITLTKAGNDNYLPVTTTYTFSVAKAEQATLNNTGKTTATFGDTPLTVSATGGSTDGEVTATNSSNQSVATVSGTQITITGVGDTTITLTKAGNNNYLPITTTYTFSVAKAEQATLNNTGKTTATFGDTPLTVSATGGSTDGEVTATNSSNQSVATVSGTQITITGVGTTTITLTKAGDNNYLPITTTYTLTVVSTVVSGVATITAQVGANSSTVQVTNPASSAYTVYVSKDTYCDPENSGATCDDTQIIPANDSIEFTAAALTFSTPTFGILESTTGNTTTFAISADTFRQIYSHQVVEMNGDLYLIGGHASNGTYKNDVWKSSDNGQTWLEISPQTNANDTTKFTPRYAHQVVTINDVMYLIGGNDGSRRNDVWKSSNGVSWEEVDTSTSSEIFTPRYRHQVVVKGDDMYLIGGFDGSRRNDVWKSTDNGQNWVEILAHNENPGDTRFTPIYDHQVVVKGDDMYLIGGFDGSRRNDVWKSSDGANWQPVETTGEIFTPRINHQVVVKGDDMYLIGGNNYKGEYTNDVWKSTNSGKTWEQQTEHARFVIRAEHQVVVVDNTMLVIGGIASVYNTVLNDVWSSTNGKDWEPVNSVHAKFDPIANHQVVEMDSELYLVGGYTSATGTAYKNDIWKSSDTGRTWTQVETTGEIFTPRYRHQVVVKDGAMYLIGGDDGSYKNDVWKSIDKGVTWTQELAHSDPPSDTQFAPKDAHQVVVLGEHMYLIGGRQFDNMGFFEYTNDVWKSSDGKSWEKVETTGDIFGARRRHQVVVLGEHMYVIGGEYDSSPYYYSDVWKSSDGIAWTQVKTTSEMFGLRGSHQVAVKDGAMYLIGGYNGAGNHRNDIWKSTDQGVTWQNISDDANSNHRFAPRWEHQVVVVDDTILVIGGNDGDLSFDDVWSSTDGSNWFLHVQVAVPLN